ncbi:MAG: hypothetical protein HZA91_16240 [Verrucomicrobia bacterium]|nr:hypothetical protein [Verrucomicrobiota bacterium]
MTCERNISVAVGRWFGILAVAALAASAQGPAVSWDKARSHVGQLCSVEGPVMQVQQTRESFSLHFSKNLKTDFAVIIFASNAARWPGKIDALYAAKKVCVTGIVRKVAGRPEMVIADPSQITVLGDAPEALAAAAGKAATPAKTGMPAAALPAATTTNVIEATSQEPPLLLPFTCDVKRFTGVRRGTGGDTASGNPFRQRIYVELTLQNTSAHVITDIEWQWVAVVMSVGTATDQYTQGTESQIELKPFESKTLRSDEVKMAGITTSRYGQTSGTRFRGYYVRVIYKGRCVFKEANSPEIEQDIESYLEKLERQKRSGKKS